MEMPEEMELRIIPSSVELRESEDGKRTITGYAVKWNQLSERLGYYYRFRERFTKGAFADSLKSDTQKAHWNHNTDTVLGSTRSGTLRLLEDDTGLRFENDLPNNSWGNDAYESIKRGDVDGVSFAFRKEVEEWDESDPDNIVRTISKAKLREVSPTPYPAYPQSEVQARNYDPYKEYKDSQAGDKPDEIKAATRAAYSNLRKKLLEV